MTLPLASHIHTAPGFGTKPNHRRVMSAAAPAS
jgi:hypothetical protein